MDEEIVKLLKTKFVNYMLVNSIVSAVVGVIIWIIIHGI